MTDLFNNYSIKNSLCFKLEVPTLYGGHLKSLNIEELELMMMKLVANLTTTRLPAPPYLRFLKLLSGLAS